MATAWGEHFEIDWCAATDQVGGFLGYHDGGRVDDADEVLTEASTA
jgi:hypothetical protein